MMITRSVVAQLGRLMYPSGVRLDDLLQGCNTGEHCWSLSRTVFRIEFILSFILDSTYVPAIRRSYPCHNGVRIASNQKYRFLT